MTAMTASKKKPGHVYVLKLYITGQTASSQKALADIKRICEAEMKGRYQLKIIDVLKKPHLAREDRILATPTLIKQLPPPLRKLVGDLSNKDRVLLGLDLYKP